MGVGVGVRGNGIGGASKGEIERTNGIWEENGGQASLSLCRVSGLKLREHSSSS